MLPDFFGDLTQARKTEIMVRDYLNSLATGYTFIDSDD